MYLGGNRRWFVSETVNSDHEVKLVRLMDFYSFVNTSAPDQNPLKPFVVLCNLYLNARY